MLTIGSAIDGAAKEIEKRWECFELGETAYRFLHETVISVQDSVTQNSIKGKTQKLHPFKEDHAALKLLSLAYLYLRKSLDNSIKNAFSNLMSKEIHQVPHCQSITACEVLSTQQLKWATVLLISVPESSIVNIEVGSFVVLQYHPKNDVELLEQAFPKSLLGFVEYVMDTPHSISKESRIVISVRYCHPFYFCNLSPGSSPCLPSKYFYLEKGSIIFLSPMSRNVSVLIFYFIQLVQELKVAQSKENDLFNSLLVSLRLINPVNVVWNMSTINHSSRLSRSEKSLKTGLHYLEQCPFDLQELNLDAAEGVVISGCPGSGKTTLFKNLLLRYANGTNRLVGIVSYPHQVVSYAAQLNTILDRQNHGNQYFEAFSDEYNVMEDSKKSLAEIKKNLVTILNYLEAELFHMRDTQDTQFFQESCGVEWNFFSDQIHVITLEKWKQTWVEMCPGSPQQDFWSQSKYEGIQSHMVSLKILLDRLWEVIVGRKQEVKFIKLSLAQWLHHFGHIHWRVYRFDIPKNHEIGLNPFLHPILCILWVAGKFLLRSLVSLQSKAPVSKNNFDCSHEQNVAQSSLEHTYLASRVVRSPQAIYFEFKAVKALLTYVESIEDSLLIRLCFLRHSLVLVPCYGISASSFSLLQSVLCNTTHLFVDDVEHVPSLFLMLVLVTFMNSSFTTLHPYSYPFLTLFTSLSPQIQTHTYLKEFTPYRWTYRKLHTSFILRSEQLALMKQMNSIVGSECLVSSKPCEALQYNGNLIGSSSTELPILCLTSTSFINPFFAFHKENIKGTSLLEAAVTEVWIQLLDSSKSQPLVIFVMSFHEKELKSIYPFFKKDWGDSLLVEFGVPEDFLGRHCDIAFILLLCSGTVSCHLLNSELIQSFENVSKSVPQSSFLFNMKFRDCPYCLVEPYHRMRLALTRARYSTHFIGSSLNFVTRHPFSCFSSNLHDYFSKENIYFAHTAESAMNFYINKNFKSIDILLRDTVKCISLSPLKRRFKQACDFTSSQLLNMLIASCGVQERLQNSLQKILHRRCLGPLFVRDTIQVDLCSFQDIKYSKFTRGLDLQLVKQCNSAYNTLCSSLDWEISVSFFSTHFSANDIIKILESFSKQQFIKFFPFDSIETFDFQEFFTASKSENICCPFNNTSKSFGPLVRKSHKYFKSVLVIPISPNVFVQKKLLTIDELSLIAPVFNKKAVQVILVGCFEDFLPWSHLSQQRTSYFSVSFQKQLSLLYLGLQWINPSITLKILHFNKESFVNLKEFLYMLMLINCDQDLHERPCVCIIKDLKFRNEAYYYCSKIKKASEDPLSQTRVKSGHSTSQESDLPYSPTVSNQNNTSFVHMNGFSESSASIKNLKKITKQIHNIQDAMQESFLKTCFPGRLTKHSRTRKHVSDKGRSQHTINGNQQFFSKRYGVIPVGKFKKQTKKMQSGNSSPKEQQLVSQKNKVQIDVLHQNPSDVVSNNSKTLSNVETFTDSYNSSRSESCISSMISFLGRLKKKPKEYLEKTIEKRDFTKKQSSKTAQHQPNLSQNTQIIPHWRLKLLHGEQIEEDAVQHGDRFLKKFNTYVATQEMQETVDVNELMKRKKANHDSSESLSSMLDISL